MDVEKGRVPDNNVIAPASDQESVRPESGSRAGRKLGPEGSTGRGSAGFLPSILRFLNRAEARGIAPVPVEERTEKRAINVFTLWWTMNANILAITFGMLAPSFGLGLRDASLVIIFFSLLTAAPTSYLSTLGPKTGMRQMVQARYSWGRYLVTLPVILNLATLTGFCVVMAVIGGQCLSAVAGEGSLTPNVGIVIMALLSLFISFCGFRVLHYYERWASIPAVIAIIVATGCGGEGLKLQSTPPVTTVAAVFSFGMIVASYMIPWAALASDFTTYLEPSTSAIIIFVYSFVGLVTPPVLLMILGAAIAGAVPSNPTWEAGYDRNLVGGVLDAMLTPAGGFGKFLVVVLSFSLLGNLSATSYSVSLNLQQLFAPLTRGSEILKRVPRYAYTILLTALVIPIGIRAAQDFFVSLENFLGLIGYWSAAFVSLLMVEHLWFRGGDCASYDPAIWNDGARLPIGVAALVSSVLSFLLVVPSMSQVWWTGPIAQVTGDLGFEFAFVVTGLLYVPFRTLEKHLTKR
ncbi:hypothetical protein MCOR25_005159 [Pyricularia grisea]|uniref:Uncharacterized protein n=1 Tax=Pyricularia grisea TaxID=148305 RepID=A0A6P8BGZ1_PYRGI|nr:uncharacterized protein PgNI_01457 [Pyricularia grisea]KAI6366344.1 hypothetical protein MCOR25_005159 [Pyricularia grisea]TLD15980.1 hypothetical protein PgNI_01457 [Pyricularia grisea]